LSQRLLLFSKDKVFNSIASELFASSQVFQIEVTEKFTSEKNNIEPNKNDVLLFFSSGKGSTKEFKSFLSKKSLNSPLLIINLSEEEEVFKENKTLYFDLPVNFSALCQALDKMILTRNDPEYCDLKFKNLQLNMTTRVIDCSKVKIRLTDKEAKILWHLIYAKGLSVNQNYLLDKVWGYREGIETKTLTTHIYTLRKKLNDPRNLVSIQNSERGYFIS